MRIVFTSINQDRQLFDPRGPVEEITFPMNCRGEIILFPSDISRFSRDTVPPGDSFYTFVPGDNTGPGPSTGSIDGVRPDFFYLALVDLSGQAFSGSGLPQSLTLSDFSAAFVGIDYGPLGAGNTDTIFFLSSLNTVSTPEPPTVTIVAIGLFTLAMAMLRTKRLRSYSKG